MLLMHRNEMCARGVDSPVMIAYWAWSSSLTSRTLRAQPPSSSTSSARNNQCYHLYSLISVTIYKAKLELPSAASMTTFLLHLWHIIQVNSITHPSQVQDTVS